ncbi:MAG: ABC transporter permease [Planctomycetaceae bacterium]
MGEFENGNSDRLQQLRKLMSTAFGPFVALIFVLALFSVADVILSYFRWDRAPQFPTWGTAQQILRDSSKVGIAALGMTIIIVAGGIDLSAGTAMALCATVTAWFFANDWPVAVAVGMGIMTGCLTGMINGTLISLLRVVPFIVTLGTMTIFLGTGLILSGNTPIRAYGKVPDWLLNLQNPIPVPQWLGVSSGVWLMLFLAILVWLVFKYSVFGRHVYALGSNEMTARLCGINVFRLRIWVYMLSGFFVGIAGLYQFVMLGGEGDPTGGTGVELEVIAAVVIGGGSLNGGRGSVWGTISGTLIMSSILTGCVTLKIDSSYQKVILGVIIVVAVTLDQLRQRRLNKAG